MNAQIISRTRRHFHSYRLIQFWKKYHINEPENHFLSSALSRILEKPRDGTNPNPYQTNPKNLPDRRQGRARPPKLLNSTAPPSTTSPRQHMLRAASPSNKNKRPHQSDDCGSSKGKVNRPQRTQRNSKRSVSRKIDGMNGARSGTYLASDTFVRRFRGYRGCYRFMGAPERGLGVGGGQLFSPMH